MTEKQLSRMERNNEIGAMFKTLRKKYPGSSLERLFTEIAKDYQLTTAAIRNICQKRGLC